MELEILENTKMLLGLDGEEKDTLIAFLICDMIDAVMAYCRIEVLPRQLYGLIAQMCAGLYRSRGYGENTPAVKSVTEGQRRVEFENAEGLFADYSKRLEPFINKSARLPSELEVGDE